MRLSELISAKKPHVNKFSARNKKKVRNEKVKNLNKLYMKIMSYMGSSLLVICKETRTTQPTNFYMTIMVVLPCYKTAIMCTPKHRIDE